MTNREWLESLSDEELAKWIEGNFIGCAVCMQKECDGASVECIEGYKKFLQAEHKEED